MTKQEKRSFFISLFFTLHLDCIFLRLFLGYVLSTFCLTAKRNNNDNNNNNNNPLKTPKLLFFLLHIHVFSLTRIQTDTLFFIPHHFFLLFYKHSSGNKRNTHTHTHKHTQCKKGSSSIPKQIMKRGNTEQKLNYKKTCSYSILQFLHLREIKIILSF